jgi:excisionase family DNA binding protein
MLGDELAMQIEKIVLHVSDAASLLGVSSQKIYEIIHNREPRAFKAGKAWKIYSTDVEDYVKSRLAD